MMESQSEKSFELKFYNYQRKEGQSSALLMSKLIDFFRKSKGYEADHELNETEIYVIKRRFIDCLEPTLANLLEDKLSDAAYRAEDINRLDKLAARCMKIEETFKIGIHGRKSNVNHVNHISQPQQSSEMLTLIESINNLKKGLNDLSSEVKSNQRQTNHFPKRENYGKSRNFSKGGNQKQKIDFTPTEGYCVRHIKGNCRFGENCRYKHSDPPKHVVDHINEFM